MLEINQIIEIPLQADKSFTVHPNILLVYATELRSEQIEYLFQLCSLECTIPLQ